MTALRIGGETTNKDLTPQLKTLKAVKRGSTYKFWFSRRTKSGQAMLLLEESNPAMKSIALTIIGDAPKIRGQIKYEPWGFLFKTRRAYPNFLQDLAQWVGKHKKEWPKLEHLIDSRLIVVDNQGETVEKYKDKQAWQSLKEQT